MIFIGNIFAERTEVFCVNNPPATNQNRGETDDCVVHLAPFVTLAYVSKTRLE